VVITNGGSDGFINNVFAGQSTLPLLQFSSDNGTLVRGNQFTDPAGGAVAIQAANSQGVLIFDNIITLAAGSIGIDVSSPGGATSFTLLNNRISTNYLGTGVRTTASGGSNLLVTLANNDFVANLVGVAVVGNGTAGTNAFGNIDLGGGGTSGGGNDFHLFNGVGGHFAITTSNSVATSAVVRARSNIFSVPNPGTVVSAPVGSIDLVLGLDPASAFVELLYADFLHRSAGPADLSFWLGIYTSFGPAAVANGIVRSGERFSYLVNDLYIKLLGRPADAGGLAGWVGLLVSGRTIEDVITGIASSPEFFGRANALYNGGTSDQNFITALYNLLLNRSPSSGELSFWTSVLPSVGRVNALRVFLTTAEFRNDVVATSYSGLPAGSTPNIPSLPAQSVLGALTNLLHRLGGPSAGELAFWLTQNVDILSLQIRLALSPEFSAAG
jgi:hypothetical protein